MIVTNCHEYVKFAREPGRDGKRIESIGGPLTTIDNEVDDVSSNSNIFTTTTDSTQTHLIFFD